MRECTRVATMLLSAVALVFSVAARGQTSGATKVPAYSVDARSLTFTIVRAVFVQELEGCGAKFVEPKPEKYRGLVVTVRIAHTSAEFVLRAQDFTLHYDWGRDAQDVAPCAGLSACSAKPDEQRDMVFCAHNINLSREVKPTSTECYVHMFFTDFEASTRQIRLHLATPVAAPVHVPSASGATRKNAIGRVESREATGQGDYGGSFWYRIVDAQSVKYDTGLFSHEVSVTLRIEKAVGKVLALHSSDFTLHYAATREGEEDEASTVNCDEMSDFSLTAAGERRRRPVVRQQTERLRADLSCITDAAMTAADELYLDLTFRGVRPGARELHVLHARPVTATFAVQGWE